MNGIISLFLLLAAGGLVTIFLVTIFLVVVWLLAHAKILFMFPQEGQGYAVTRGGAYTQNERDQIVTQGGVFRKLIVTMRGRRLELDQAMNTWKIVDGESEHEGLLGLAEKYLGMYYIGIWPIDKVYRYEFRWNVWDPNKKEPEIMTRDDPTDYFYVSTFRYGVSLDSAETGTTLAVADKKLGGNIRVNIKFSLFVRIIYPEIALFRNVHWFIQLQEYAVSAAKDYVGLRDFNDLRAETNPSETTAQGTFSDAIVHLNTEIKGQKDGVLKLLGVEIVNAQMLTVDVVDEDGKVRAALTTIYVQDQEAKGYAVAVKTRAEADALAIKERYGAIHGFEHGPQIRRLEAIEKAGEKGNVVVFDSGDDGESSSSKQTKLLSAILATVKERNNGDEDARKAKDKSKPQGGA